MSTPARSRKPDTLTVESVTTLETAPAASEPNGQASFVVKRSSNDPAQTRAELEAEDAKAAEVPKPPADSTDLSARIEVIDTKEADQILAELIEYEGRLPIAIRRRGQPEETVYCRVLRGSERKVAELYYSKRVHHYRTEEKLPAMAEFITNLYDTFPPERKAEIERIQEDPDLTSREKNQRITDYFRESAFFPLVQLCADSYANADYLDKVVTLAVEMFAETEGVRAWRPVWITPEALGEEDEDVKQEIVLSVLTTHAKLQSARFLASSSGAAKTGAMSAGSPPSIN